MHNTIILTHGWTGSSVFAGLLQKAGAWLGEETVRKPDYDTHENSELVRLNRGLIERLGGGFDHEREFDARHVERIASACAGIDPAPLRQFVATCEAHQPWVWKDPRLTWTIRAWAPHLDLRRTRFLLLTREPMQAWITSNLRRHIQSYAATVAYNEGITAINRRFLQEHGLTAVEASFEDLLLRPERTLSRLSAHLEVSLGLEDLEASCRLPLGRRSRGPIDALKAAAIFLKNYGERDGRGRVSRSASRPVSAREGPPA